MSRRFKNRHAKVQADPNALPTAPVVLDDSNSFVDPTQSDRRIPNELNTRAYVTAESLEAADRDAAVGRARANLAQAEDSDDDETA